MFMFNRIFTFCIVPAFSRIVTNFSYKNMTTMRNPITYIPPSTFTFSWISRNESKYTFTENRKKFDLKN
uniref:Uncharacterized protein n=1 Tax=Meloidogyne incognita TaxID=6306 RepID=A0A914N7T3_MELIC